MSTRWIKRGRENKYLFNVTLIFFSSISIFGRAVHAATAGVGVGIKCGNVGPHQTKAGFHESVALVTHLIMHGEWSPRAVLASRSGTSRQRGSKNGCFPSALHRRRSRGLDLMTSPVVDTRSCGHAFGRT